MELRREGQSGVEGGEMFDERERRDLVGRIRKGSCEMVTVALRGELVYEHALRQYEHAVVMKRAGLTRIFA